MGKPKAADTINGYKVVQYRYATPPAAVAKVGAGKRKRQGERPAVAAVRYLYCKMHGANKKKKDTPEKGKGKKVRVAIVSNVGGEVVWFCSLSS